MAMTITLAPGANAGAVAGQAETFVATVTNTGTSSTQLQSLSVFEVTKVGVTLAQPNIYVAGQPAGTASFPVLAAGASANYAFTLVCPTPYGAGPNPSNPGGANPATVSQPALNSSIGIGAMGQFTDGSIGNASQLLVPVLSAIAPFPVAPLGGAFQFGQGSNLLTGLTLFAL